MKFNLEKIERSALKEEDHRYNFKKKMLHQEIIGRVKDSIKKEEDIIDVSREEIKMINEFKEENDEFYKDFEVESDGFFSYVRFRNFKKKKKRFGKLVILAFLVLLFGLYVAFNVITRVG